jgi:hypothetical protein
VRSWRSSITEASRESRKDSYVRRATNEFLSTQSCLQRRRVTDMEISLAPGAKRIAPEGSSPVERYTPPSNFIRLMEAQASPETLDEIRRIKERSGVADEVPDTETLAPEQFNSEDYLVNMSLDSLFAEGYLSFCHD